MCQALFDEPATPDSITRWHPDHALARSIIGLVCACTATSFEKMMRRCNQPYIFYIRATAMSLIVEFTHLSLAEVSQLFGRGAHGTTLNACRRVRDRRDVEPAFDRWFRKIAAEARALAQTECT